MTTQHTVFICQLNTLSLHYNKQYTHVLQNSLLLHLVLVKDDMEMEQINHIPYVLRNIGKWVLTRKTITSSTDKSVAVQLVIGKKEPYFCIVSFMTKDLFTDTNKDLSLPEHYFWCIEGVCEEIISLYPSLDFTCLSLM